MCLRFDHVLASCNSMSLPPFGPLTYTSYHTTNFYWRSCHSLKAFGACFSFLALIATKVGSYSCLQATYGGPFLHLYHLMFLGASYISYHYRINFPFMLPIPLKIHKVEPFYSDCSCFLIWHSLLFSSCIEVFCPSSLCRPYWTLAGWHLSFLFVAPPPMFPFPQSSGHVFGLLYWLFFWAFPFGLVVVLSFSIKVFPPLFVLCLRGLGLFGPSFWFIYGSLLS